MPTRSQDQLVADARAVFTAAVDRVRADRLIEAVDLDTCAPEPLASYDRVHVLGMGKAAMALAGVLEKRLGDLEDAPPLAGGTVVVPGGYPDTLPADLPPPQTIAVCVGGHPTPTYGSIRAGEALLETAEAAGPRDLVWVLISGGGTSLATVPAEGLALEDLEDTYRLMLRGGVDVQGANVVRKHLTQVGGGQLARALAPAHGAAFAVSDVVGNDLSTIASGPTVPDPSTYADAMRVLYRAGLWGRVPDPVREHLRLGADGRRRETPTEDADCFQTVPTRLIGTNEMALDAAQAEAKARGYTVHRADAPLEGEAAEVGRVHARALLEAAGDAPVCLLWGGETTVTVTGNGTGGRNQESVLGAVEVLEGAEQPAVFLSGGTDGIDGPTDAAGAWATPETVARARTHGLAAADHLSRNDSTPYFRTLDQLLTPGPTHTNVMDVQVGMIG